jgi:hypothetical protein
VSTTCDTFARSHAVPAASKASVDPIRCPHSSYPAMLVLTNEWVQK